MENKEVLNLILKEIKGLRIDTNSIKSDMIEMKSDIVEMKSDISNLNKKVDKLEFKMNDGFDTLEMNLNRTRKRLTDQMVKVTENIEILKI